MAEESDTGSIQSSQSEQGTDRKTFEDSRFYALYLFCGKRCSTPVDEADTESNAEDGNLSLAIAATNLSAPSETELRKSLSQRLAKITSTPNEGNFLSVGLSNGNDDSISSAVCYYCILNGSTTVTALEEETTPSGRQYVVCFISFLDSSLDLFRPELDHYTGGLTPLLDAEPAAIRAAPPGSSTADSTQGQLSQIDGAVKEYLEHWYDVVLEYLARCVAKLGTNVHYLIYSALLDAQLTMKGFTLQEETDINKFIKCCSLSSLLQQMQTDGVSKKDSDLLLNFDTSLSTFKTVSATLTAKENSFIFDVDGFSSTCQFCKMATEHLMSGDPKNVTKIKETLESVKLAFIHNLNKLKRFLRQAETDHYALFRSLIYLKKSGAGDLLLRYVHLDASVETLSVLNVLQDFIKTKGQALV